MIDYPFTQKFTMCIAHPDDEVIFGFGMLKNTKKIICCSNEFLTSKKHKNTNGKSALIEIGKLINIPVICLEYPRNFYRLETYHNQLYNFSQDIIKLASKEKVVSCHNSWGEYGNLDHILLHQILRTCTKAMITTDISVSSELDLGRTEWLPVKKFTSGKFLGEVTNDPKLYNQCHQIYEQYNCWTWNKPPIEKTNLYIQYNYPKKNV
jgi:hypothetical protein